MLRIALLSVAALCMLSATGQTPTPDKPNVLFIIADDLNDYVGHLEAMPNSYTPNLDRLAKRGISFTNAYCNVPQCAPSRSSMISGKYPTYTEIYQGGQYDNSDYRGNFDGNPVFTIPEVLKDSGGYYTAVVSKFFHGKNHNPPFIDVDYDTTGSDNCARGKSWSEWIPANTANPEPDSANLYGLQGYEWGTVNNADEPQMLDFKSATRAQEFINDYAADPAAFCDKPFFLAVGIFRPHFPFFTPEKYFDENYQPDIYQTPYDKPYNDPPNAFPLNGIKFPDQPEVPNADYDNLPFIGKINANGNVLSPDQGFDAYAASVSPRPVFEPGIDSATTDFILSESYKANAIAAYLAGVRYMDAQLGRVLEALESNPDLLSNTIIVFVSDHGYAVGEKRHWGKVALWDQVLRVPMVVVDPRRSGNQQSPAVTSLIDLFPTLLDLTNTPHPVNPDGSDYLDGVSLLPQLDNPSAIRSFPSVSSEALGSSSYIDGTCFPHFSVRTDQFHYIRYLTNNAADSAVDCFFPDARVQEELYEIGLSRNVDPEEFVNLANEPEYRGVMDYMAQFLPSGPLYGQSAGHVDIEHDTLPCVLNIKNDNFLTATWYGVDGVPIAGSPPGYIFTWDGNAFTSPVNGQTVNIKRNILDSVVLASVDQLVVRVRATDTINNVFFEDVISLSVKNEDVPSIGFTISQPDPITAQVQNVVQTGAVDKLIWNFGDGFITEGGSPPPHSYTLPNFYEIQATVEYGNDARNVCVKRSSQFVTINSIDFDSAACQTPAGVKAPEITANSVRLLWDGVYQGVGYELRLRTLDPIESPWIETLSLNNFLTIKNLLLNEEYEFRVRAVCSGVATDTSDWSQPFRFHTDPCYAPYNVFVSDITPTTAQVNWSKHNPKNNGHQVLAQAATGGPKLKLNVLDDENVVITGLDSATQYLYKIVPFCPDGSGNPRIKGESTDIFDFSTSAARIGQMGELLLYPNPTSGLIQLNLPTEARGMLNIQVLDINGRLLYSSQENAEQGNIQIDASNWESGSYLVEVRDQQGDSSATTLIVQH